MDAGTNTDVFPRWVATADHFAMLREAATNLYVGAETAVYARPSPTREWWAVVDVGPRRGADTPRETSLRLAFRVVRCSFDDGDPVPPWVFESAAALYRHAGGPVLVSCGAGASRSASVAYALLRTVAGLSHADAVARVALPGGGPMPATLASAKRWADTRSVGAP